MNTEHKKLIEKGELAREQHDFQTALTCFDNAIIQSIKDKNYVETINSLGHHLLVFDRLFKQTANVAFLELMFMDTLSGLRLAEKYHIKGRSLAVMQLRQSQYYLETKDFAKAEEGYQKAFDELSSDPIATNEEKAEYLGHLAEAIIYQGDISRAEPLFRKSHELLAQHSAELRRFHELIIQSGLDLRECHGLYLSHHVDKAKSLLLRIEPIVLELKETHNMVARYEQWVELKTKINS